MGQYNSFVVKIWTNEATAKFRGHIQHVGSQESTYFVTTEKMVKFIMDHLKQYWVYPGKDRVGEYRDSQEDEGNIE